MSNTRTSFLLLVLPLLGLLLPAPAAHSAEASDPFARERALQEQIYRSRGDAQPAGYVTDRSLLSYTHTLAAGFDDALAALGPDQRWLDLGAGEGRAVLDYYGARFDAMHPTRNAGKARAVALSIEDRRTARWHARAAAPGGERIAYLAGRRLRDYAPAELGRFELISDVAGGFSYTGDLAGYTARVLAALTVGGRFFTMLTDVASPAGTAQPWFTRERFLTTLEYPDGGELAVCDWLQRIRCAEVICETRMHWQPPVETFIVRKTCESVHVPPLQPLAFEAGTPPARRFGAAR